MRLCKAPFWDSWGQGKDLRRLGSLDVHVIPLHKCILISVAHGKTEGDAEHFVPDVLELKKECIFASFVELHKVLPRIMNPYQVLQHGDPTVPRNGTSMVTATHKSLSFRCPLLSYLPL